MDERLGKRRADGSVETKPVLNVRGQPYLSPPPPSTYSLGDGYFVVIPVGFRVEHNDAGEVINPEIIEVQGLVPRSRVRKSEDE